MLMERPLQLLTPMPAQVRTGLAGVCAVAGKGAAMVVFAARGVCEGFAVRAHGRSVKRAQGEIACEAGVTKAFANRMFQPSQCVVMEAVVIQETVNIDPPAGGGGGEVGNVDGGTFV